MNITKDDLNWLKRLTLYWQKPTDWYDRFKQRQEGNTTPIRTDCRWNPSIQGKCEILEPVLWFGEIRLRHMQDNAWIVVLVHKSPMQGNHFDYWIEEPIMTISTTEEEVKIQAENIYHRYNNAIVMAHAWYGHYLVENNNTFTCFCPSDYEERPYKIFDGSTQTENYDVNLSNWKEKIERIHQERIEELLDSDTLIENGIVKSWY